MRSLKLPGLIRRNPDRPSLRQRAAGLKETAARLIRRPPADGSPEDLVARAAANPGFMAYPANHPEFLVNTRIGLRLEAKRLLDVACSEFTRLYAAQSVHQDEAGCQAVAERLRYQLRIEALEVAAADEDPTAESGLAVDPHTMAGGIVEADGAVSYCDAAGKVHHGSVADWIGFTASRLYAQARKEMARQVNDPSLSDDERAALSLKLRSELRVDALRILAFRSYEAFSLAKAAIDDAQNAPIPEPREYRIGPVSMDLQIATEAHREAMQILIRDTAPDDERWTAARERIRGLADAIREMPARSHADLRHKVLYLWPGSLEGETVSAEQADTLNSFMSDITRLGIELGPEIPAIEGATDVLPADARLLEIGSRLDVAEAEFRAFRPTFDRAQEGMQAAQTEAASRLQGVRECDLIVELETLEAPFRADLDKGAALSEAHDAITEEAMLHRPMTLAGAAVLARAARFWWLDAFEKKRTDLDYSDALVVSLIDGVLSAVDMQKGRPDPMGAFTADLVLREWAANEAVPYDDNAPDGGPEIAASLDRRHEILDAADNLPATMENLGAKVVALAWMVHSNTWLRDQPRGEYDYDGRLALDIWHIVTGSSPYQTPNGSDPALMAIAYSRWAETEMAAWQSEASTRQLTEADFDEERRLEGIQIRSRKKALSTVPTTQEGRLALVEYVRLVHGLYGIKSDGSSDVDHPHVWKRTHAALMAALAAPIQAEAGA